MECRSCGIRYNPNGESEEMTLTNRCNIDRSYKLEASVCPDCGQLAIVMFQGRIVYDGEKAIVVADDACRVIYPQGQKTFFPECVPEKIVKDFNEAKMVLPISPRASAALSRCLLQYVLRTIKGIQEKTLEKEIDQYIQKCSPPVPVIQYIDAIRQVGNYSAHPCKEQHTSEFVEVTIEEAEWILELLKGIIHFEIIKPHEHKFLCEQINHKLLSMGKNSIREII